MIENKAPINGLSGSIKLGVEACRACDADAVLIALADMPRVTATHIYRLLDYADGADTIMRGRHSRSEEHTSELQSLMRISYAVFCLKKKKLILHNTA